jgi:hypothetical protein
VTGRQSLKEKHGPDPDWPQWYAEHLTRTLGEDGYRLSGSEPHEH